MYKLNAASLVAPAGGLAGTFIGSETFGPLLLSEVTASEDFQKLVDAANTENYAPDTAQYAALVEAVYAGFLPSFAFAVQTALDSADPINHAAMLKATGLPVHLIEVVGDGGDTNLPDQVLPSRVDNYPLSGTEPLIDNLELACISSTSVGSGAVRFTKGDHSSLINPEGSAAATIEMQAQVAGYAQTASQGSASITIGDESVIKPCSVPAG